MIAEPLRLERIFLTKVWGGRVLEQVPGIELGVEGPVGETWELVDREDHVSVVRGGSLDGRSLRGLMMSEAEALLGETPATVGGGPRCRCAPIGGTPQAFHRGRCNLLTAPRRPAIRRSVGPRALVLRALDPLRDDLRRARAVLQGPPLLCGRWHNV